VSVSASPDGGSAIAGFRVMRSLDSSAPRNARTPLLILESIVPELRILSSNNQEGRRTRRRSGTPPSGGRIKQQIRVAPPAGFDRRERVA
jgi:hypothetical protein